MLDLARAKGAIERVKAALGRDEEGPLSCYVLAGGRIAAASRSLAAAAPFPWFGEAVVSGKEFEEVLALAPNDPEFSIKDDHLVLSVGKWSGKVRLPKVSVEASAAVFEVPPSNPLPFDEETRAKFEVLKDFISDDPQPAWMNSLVLQRGRASAVGPSASIYAFASVPDFGGDALIPKRALLAILSGETPETIDVGKNAVVFGWPDGSWLRSSLVDGKVPGTIDKLAEMAAISPTSWEVDPAWRTAFDRIAGFARDEVTFYADRIVGRSGVAEAEEGVETPVPASGSSKWPTVLAKLVVANSDRWNPATYPSPSPFAGQIVRGLVTGRN